MSPVAHQEAPSPQAGRHHKAALIGEDPRLLPVEEGRLPVEPRIPLARAALILGFVF
jgi:hypothetical protein